VQGQKRDRSDGGDAFIPESAQISGTPDDLAEFLGEQYLREAVDDDDGEGSRDEEVTEELGGPFVESAPEQKFGSTQEGGRVGEDGVWAQETPTVRVRSPFPQAVGPLAIAAPDGSTMEPAVNIESPSSDASSG
jgi:hypothetical protein